MSETSPQSAVAACTEWYQEEHSPDFLVILNEVTELPSEEQRIELLKRTLGIATNRRVIYRLSLYLACDLHLQSVADILVNLLNNRSIHDSVGTVSYCLSQLDSRPYVSYLPRWIASSNAEVAMSSVSMLEDNLPYLTVEEKRRLSYALRFHLRGLTSRQAKSSFQARILRVSLRIIRGDSFEDWNWHHEVLGLKGS